MPRSRGEPPYVFSIELLNAGSGESILVHYGTPDDVKLVMINAGPRARYRTIIEPRLRQLRAAQPDGGPLPIELFIVGDRDEDKTGGLLAMLSHLAEVRDAGQPPPLIELRGVWANIFRVQGERDNFRSRIRRLIDDLHIPLKQPFDRFVVHPETGRAVVDVPGGLEVTVLGPAQRRLDDLHRLSAREAQRIGGTIEPLEPESFSKLVIKRPPAPLSVGEVEPGPEGECVPSENARGLAGGSYRDQSLANLASTILLFRFRGMTFLHTGDSRGDQIQEGLVQSGLMDAEGRVTVDLLTIPHLGSDHNVTLEFFMRVRASGYLFSGDGTYGNPEIATVASLISARGCDRYLLYFVNRTGADDAYGAKLDTFLEAERTFSPNCRRVFRSPSSGSVIIDLLDPVRR